MRFRLADRQISQMGAGGRWTALLLESAICSAINPLTSFLKFLKDCANGIHIDDFVIFDVGHCRR